MVSPAAGAQFASTGGGIQKAFGGQATPQESQLYASNPAAVVMAPFFGILQKGQGGQGQSSYWSGSTAGVRGNPSAPQAGVNPTNTGQKTLLGQ